MIIKIIIIIIIIIIFYLLLFVKQNDPNKYEPIYNYSDIKENFKTGDIILFSCKKNGSFGKKLEYYLRTNFIGSEFGHIGIIIKNKKGKMYVIESTNKNHCGEKYCHKLNTYDRGGIRIIGLNKLLNKYNHDNDAIFAVRFISKEIPLSVAIKKLNNYQNFTFPDKRWLYLLAIVDVGISHTTGQKLSKLCNENEMMCSEFVYDFLYNCGILKYYPSKIFWPHLVTNGILDNLAIVPYSKLYKFNLTAH